MTETDTPLLSEKFTEATTYALEKHNSQIRKGSDVPYASHVLAVAAIVLEMGSNEDEAIAALLHDVVEDQGGLETAAEIRKQFGDRVAEIVLACSDSSVSDPAAKRPWRERMVA